MSLFGSIGIGPIRVGASTSGGRRSSSGVGGGTAFFVILAIFLGFHYWYVVLPIAGLALFLGAIGYIIYVSEQDKAATAHRKAEIIERAEREHAQLMDGDDRGLYGDYPPAEMDND